MNYAREKNVSSETVSAFCCQSSDHPHLEESCSSYISEDITESNEISSTLDWGTLDRLTDPICLVNNTGAILSSNKSFRNFTGQINGRGENKSSIINFIEQIVHPHDVLKVSEAVTRLVSFQSREENLGICKTRKRERNNDWFEKAYREMTVIQPDYRELHLTLQGFGDGNVLVIGRFFACNSRDGIEGGELHSGTADFRNGCIWQLDTAELSGYFEDIAVPFYVIASDALVLYMNRVAREQLQYSQDDIIGHRLHEVNFYIG